MKKFVDRKEFIQYICYIRNSLQTNEVKMFTPNTMEKWKYPKNYSGPDFPNHYIFLGRNRDSDLLTNCNFDVAISRLNKIAIESEETYQIVRQGHWAVGWIELILIHENAEDCLKLAESINEKIAIYPVLNEDKLSEMEDNEASRIWKDNYSVEERIEYIRKYKNQFNFRNYSDLIENVRGNYFIGYASELISQ